MMARTSLRVLVLVVCLAVPVTAAAVDRAEFEPFEGQVITAIEYDGYSTTKEYVITREIYSRIGQPLSPSRVVADVARLDNLGIFAEILVKVDWYKSGVRMTFSFQELPSIIPYIKLKYTEENGWSIGPALTSVNMFGKDIYLSGFVLFGGTTTFSIRFKNPWIMDPRVNLDLNLDHLVRDNELYKFQETNDDISIWMGRWLGENGRLKGAVNYFAVASDRDSVTLDPSNRDDMLRLIGSVGYDGRDSWTNTHDGWHNEVELNLTGGDARYPTLTIDLRRYQPFGKRNTLAVGLLTSLRTGEVGVDIPEYMQYNLGGTNTIRGWKLDELGEVLFGKNQLIVTAEYQFLLLPVKAYPVLKWAVSGGIELAAFTDLGTAWSNTDELNGDRLKGGFGFGLRTLVPAVNELRFDFGMNLHGSFIFHFGVQTKFDAQRFRIR